MNALESGGYALGAAGGILLAGGAGYIGFAALSTCNPLVGAIAFGGASLSRIVIDLTVDKGDKTDDRTTDLQKIMIKMKKFITIFVSAIFSTMAASAASQYLGTPIGFMACYWIQLKVMLCGVALAGGTIVTILALAIGAGLIMNAVSPKPSTEGNL